MRILFGKKGVEKEKHGKRRRKKRGERGCKRERSLRCSTRGQEDKEAATSSTSSRTVNKKDECTQTLQGQYLYAGVDFRRQNKRTDDHLLSSPITHHPSPSTQHPSIMYSTKSHYRYSTNNTHNNHRRHITITISPRRDKEKISIGMG